MADRDGMKLVKRWLIAAWMEPAASFNPGIFQSECQVIGVADDRLRFVWVRVAQDIPFCDIAIQPEAGELILKLGGSRTQLAQLFDNEFQGLSLWEIRIQRYNCVC